MSNRNKQEMQRHFGRILELQRRLRALIATTGLPTELEADPRPPKNTDQLMHALRVVRTNLMLVEIDLLDFDHKVNGCETRTRAQIRRDIESDRRILSLPNPAAYGRSRDAIERNLAYDLMQMQRNSA
jgi:hypothetical protein